MYPTTRCRLRLLKMERINDYLLLEEEYVSNQERLKPEAAPQDKSEDDRSKVDDLRGTPMAVGTLEEIIDDDHAIISTASGPEYYVSIMSFVDKDQLEPGCTVLLHQKTHAVIGGLKDDTDPMVNVMKLDKAPTESYADIGGLEQQIQEIKARLTGLCSHAYADFANRKQSNFHSHTQNYTRRWVSSLQRVLFCTVCPVQEKPCSPRPWRTRPPLRSCG